MTSFNIKYGDIWLADLSPAQGTEPGKTRPVFILQNQALLDIEHPSTLIIPLTTNLIDDAEPLRVRLKAQGHLEKESDLLIDQLRAIDNKRLIKGPLLKCHSDLVARIIACVHDLISP